MEEVDAVVNTTRLLPVEPLEPHQRPEWRPISNQAVTYVAAAALDRAASEGTDSDYRYQLERIKSILGLKTAEMARLLHVSHEGLRKWSHGASIAGERLADIDDLYDFSLWLSSQIKPENIPAFMRRRIPALAGQTPIAWLMAGRSPELRALYQKAFSYEQLA
jgi:hypothetical protein